MWLTNEQCVYILSQYKNLELSYKFYKDNADISDDLSCMLCEYETGQDYYDAIKSIELCLDCINRGLDYVATYSDENRMILLRRYCNMQSVLSISHSICFKSEPSVYANVQKAKNCFSRGLNIVFQQKFIVNNTTAIDFDVRKLAKYPKIIKALVEHYGFSNYAISCITKKQPPTKTDYKKHLYSMMSLLLGTNALMLKNIHLQLIMENTNIINEGDEMNSLEYMVLNIIDNYRVLPKSSIYELVKPVIKDRKQYNNIVNKLFRNKMINLVARKDKTVCYSRNFNPHNDNIVYENESSVINKCFLVLVRLKQLYKIKQHKLSHYPSTIKFIIDDEDSKEHMFEIIYLPYSENNELVKRMGFFFEREYDKKYDVKRFAICENKWMLYNETSVIREYIPNICSFVYLPIDSSGNVLFYDPDELEGKGEVEVDE